MSTIIKMNFEPVRQLAFGGIGVDFTGVGTALSNPGRGVLIQNLTDVLLDFSFNGIDLHFPLPDQSFWVIDITANKTTSDGFFVAEGTRLYVRQNGVPTLGAVYFTVMSGEQD